MNMTVLLFVQLEYHIKTVRVILPNGIAVGLSRLVPTRLLCLERLVFARNLDLRKELVSR